MSQELNGYFLRERLPTITMSASGVVSTAPATVDIVSNLGVTASAAGLAFTLPNPTDTRSGRSVVVMNTGTNAFAMYGQTIQAGQYSEFIWGAEDTAWHAQAGSGAPAWDNPDGTPATQASGAINYMAGNVGIGTNTPAALLHTVKAGGNVARIESDGLYSGLVSYLPTSHFFSGVQDVDGVSRYNVVNNITATEALSVNAVTSNTGLKLPQAFNTLHVGEAFVPNTGGVRLPITSTSAAQTGQPIGVDANGDIVRLTATSFDATVSFSTATPTAGGVVFTPNTPASTAVLYVSSVDGSQWTYNGTTYVTQPASADWKTAGNAGSVQATNFIGTTDNVGLSFRTNNTIRQTITNTGNVGIGTTTPRHKLDLIGEIGIDAVGGYSRTWNYLNGALKWTVGLRNSNDYYIYREGVAGNVLVPLGNVGIGTTAPNAQLQLGNTVANRKIVLYEAANNDNQYYGLGINAGVLRYQIPAADNKHIFYAGTSATASNALMTIQGNGNVGIGTDAPTAKLHVIGSTKLEGSASNSGFIELQRTGQATRDAYIGYGGDGNGGIDINSEIATKPIKLTTANGNVLVSTGTGNVGIGTTAPTQKLHVIGNIIASGTITPSDKRLKSNIKDVVYGLKDLLKLKAVSYTKKFSFDKAEKGEVKEFGFIAQDLQKVMPELVTEITDKDKTLAVNYTSLIPVLVKAIQEQQLQIEALKAKVK